MKMQLTETTRTLQGCKIETSIDIEKKGNRYLLTSICGKYYNVWDSEAKENIEIVGKRNFDKWALKNDYKTDF